MLSKWRFRVNKLSIYRSKIVVPYNRQRNIDAYTVYAIFFQTLIISVEVKDFVQW